MNPNPTSLASESSKGRTDRSNKSSLRALVRNLIMRAQLWLGKLVSFPFAFPFARVRRSRPSANSIMICCAQSGPCQKRKQRD